MNVYSELPNKRADSHYLKIYKRADQNKRVENLRVWWEKNLKNLSGHACLLGSSE